MIAIGTTVVRALEHAAPANGAVRSGSGTATQRIGLRPFADDSTLAAAGRWLEAERYRTHEFGDSMLVLRGLSGGRATSSSVPPGP